MDGYRRLERTRNVAAPAQAIAATAIVEERPAIAPRRRRRMGRRLAGAARLIAFAAVLAVIIGTSVSLASSDRSNRAPARTEPVAAKTVAPAKTAAPVKTPSTSMARDTAVEVDSPAKVAAEDETAAEPTTAAAPTTTSTNSATSTATASSLPRTGPAFDARLVVLAGAALFLFGMALQIAGQPLPARNRAA